MKPPTPVHLAWARHCLTQESETVGAEGAAPTAAARVHDKLELHMAPLLGGEGVRLLLVRSAKLTQSASWLADVSLLEQGNAVRAALLATDPAVSPESAVALFETFFALLTSFIGERLTAQLVCRAWPTIGDAVKPMEKQP